MTSGNPIGSSITTQERQRLWIATIIVAIAFYPLPLIVLGGIKTLLLTVVVSQFPDKGELWIGALRAAALSLLPLGVFLLWVRPRFDRLGLPRRSFILLGLLIAYVPIEAIFYEELLSEDSLKTVRHINTTTPAIGILRHSDKPLLLILTVWAFLRGRTLDGHEQLIFHCLLALCCLAALSTLADKSFAPIFGLVFGF